MDWHRPTFDELSRRAYLLACDMERVRHWAEESDLPDITTELRHLNYGAVALRTLSLAAMEAHARAEREAKRPPAPQAGMD